MKPSEIILGIDFGDTIESRNAQGVKVELPRAMEVIARCVKECKAVYIISKANKRQKREVLEWIAQHDFYKITGLSPKNIFFCEEREDKGIIADELGVTHMVDDRPEVMAFMSLFIKTILINPNQDDVKKWFQHKTTQVSSWTEIEHILFD